MGRDFALRKQIILIGVIFLVLADVALAAYSWELSNAPNAPHQRMAIEARQHDMLKASIRRAQDIRDSIPAIQKDCDRFEQSLSPASTGYSAVRSELGGTARKNGIQLEDLSFKPTEDAARGLTEVLIDVTVTGEYKSVIGFLNGLQRSPNLFVIDALTLGSESTNQASSRLIKVSLHLRTYFRTAA